MPASVPREGARMGDPASRVRDEAVPIDRAGACPQSAFSPKKLATGFRLKSAVGA